MYVEKGHCHITVPKVEVILPLKQHQGLAAQRRAAPEAGQACGAGGDEVEKEWFRFPCIGFFSSYVLVQQEPSTPEWSAEGAIGSVESRNAAVAAPDTTNSPAPPAIASVSQVVVPNWWARQRQGFQEEQLRYEQARDVRCPWCRVTSTNVPRQPKTSYTVPAGEKDQQQSWHDAMQRLRQGLQKLSGSVGK